MLIESGKSTTASYMSTTTPIPHDKNDVAVCTVTMGWRNVRFKINFYGWRKWLINTISKEMIKSVSEEIDCPLIIGGGINTSKKALEKLKLAQILS